MAHYTATHTLKIKVPSAFSFIYYHLEQVRKLHLIFQWMAEEARFSKLAGN